MLIDIILATYNGSKYVSEQIESILNQTHTNWRLIVRDDGSTDDTVAILERYVATYPERVFLIQDGKRLGAKNSFSVLMQHSVAAYIAFADQDDVWHPDKLECLQAAMQNAETEHGVDTPLLAHSDLEVVDAQLRQISPSFWAFQGINPHRNTLAQLLCSNTVTGCSMMINRPLLNQAHPVPPEAYMHDYWLALVATIVGHIVVIETSLIKYRQHSNNTLGAIAQRSLFSMPRANFSMATWRSGFYMACPQADALYQSFTGQVDEILIKPAKILTELQKHSWIVRRWQLLRYGFLKKMRLRLLVAILLVI